MTSIDDKDPTCLFDTSWTIHRIKGQLKYSEQYQDLFYNQNSLRALVRGLKRFLDENKRPALEHGDSDSDRVGGLQNVEIVQVRGDPAKEPDGRQNVQGILITCTYDQGSYKAALFRGTKYDGRNGKDDGDVPVLLLRMPIFLSRRFLDFLSSNFEVSVTPAKIPTSMMYQMLGRYMTTLYVAIKDQSKDEREDMVSTIFKELRISFAFEAPTSPQLRLLEVNLPSAALCAVMEENLRAATHAHLAGHETNFVIEALARYLDQHTGLQIPKISQEDGSTSIRVAKLACGAFVLSADGKAKLMSGPIDKLADDVGVRALHLATEDFLNAITKIAVEQES